MDDDIQERLLQKLAQAQVNADRTADIRLWDQYAMHALAGVLSNGTMTLGYPESVASTIAEHVNAMMAERQQHVKNLFKKGGSE